MHLSALANNFRSSKLTSLDIHLVSIGAASLGCLLLAYFVYANGPHLKLNRIFSFSNMSLGFWNATDLVMYTMKNHPQAIYFDRLSYLAGIPVIYFFFRLCVETAEANPPRYLLRLLKYVSFLMSFLMLTPWVLKDVRIEGERLIETPGPLFFLFIGYFMGYLSYGLYLLFQQYRHSVGIKRTQIQYVFVALAFALMAAGSYFAALFMFPGSLPYYLVFQAVYVLLFAYAIVRYRLMDINLVFRYAFIYFLFAFTLAIPFSVLAIGTRSRVVMFISMFAALFFAPTIEKKIIGIFRQFVDKLPPFRGKYDFLTNAPGLKKLISKSSSVQLWAKNLADSFNQLLQVENVIVFVFDEANHKYLATAAVGMPLERCFYTSPSEDDALVLHLKSSKTILQKIYIDHEVPEERRGATRGTMDLMNSALCVPFFNGDYLVGFASIGKKLSRDVSSFRADHFKLPMILEELEVPSIVSRGHLFVNQLVVRSLGHSGQAGLQGISSEKLAAVFNDLIHRSGWVSTVPGLSALDMRSEGLLMLERISEKTLSREHEAVLCFSVLESIYRDALSGVFREENFNDEDLKAIEGLMHGAADALVVIFMTMASQMKSAEWAHDLRHPFTKGSFSLLAPILLGRMGPLTKEQYQALSNIQSDAKFVEGRITALVLPETAQRIYYKHTDLKAFLNDVCSRFGYFASLSNVGLKLNVPEKGVWVRCDPDQIQYRVLNNLIENAIRHTYEGGAVEVGYRLNGPKAHCFVKNIGGELIPADMVPHLFERGSRDKHPNSSSRKGLAGLGLYNVAEVLKKHESKISVRSTKEEGTVFEFDLTIE
jgi:signal transduction histidine kinase